MREARSIVQEAAELDALLGKVRVTAGMTAREIGQFCESISTPNFEVWARIDSVCGHVAVFLSRELRGSVPHFLRREAPEVPHEGRGSA